MLVAGSLGPDRPAVRAARAAHARRVRRTLRGAGRGAGRRRRRPARARDVLRPRGGTAGRSRASSRASDLPLVVSFSFDQGTRTMMGLSPGRRRRRGRGRSASPRVGANCGRSLEDTDAIVGELVGGGRRPAALGQAERRRAEDRRRRGRLRRRTRRCSPRTCARLRRPGRADRRRLLRLDARARRGDRAARSTGERDAYRADLAARPRIGRAAA